MRPHQPVRSLETRANALWGRGGRRIGIAAAAVAAALAASGAATAAPPVRAYVPTALQSAIQQSPKQTFDVILQGDPKGSTPGFVAKALADAAAGGTAVSPGQIRHEFLTIDGAELTLTGRQILTLEHSKSVTSILPNSTVQTSSVALPMSNEQKWPWPTAAAVDWNSQALGLQAPTIAIVDSGIDASLPDFGGRVLGQVDLYTGTGTNSPGDGYGHGTFVAGVAAGAAAGYAGVAPSANLLSLDVMADDGTGTVADIVSACDWILQNKDTYNIKVANFSLQGGNEASVFFDPLDQAVEKLWLNGVTVVAASGNYATDSQESGVLYAPGNDPFVITVGASDIMDTLDTSDDVVAPWSAWGYTGDGFMKPDLSAPGRYIIGPVPTSAYLTTERPDHVAAPGYMQLSGTSFSTPMVAGAAALLLAEHPDWTPDQVKGALMVSADATPAAAPGSLGTGELDVARARAVVDPPNPNAGLDQYVTRDSSGAPVFDASAWQTAAEANAAWSSAAWSSAAWSSAAWGDAAWSSAAWSSAAWSSAAWGSAAWSSAAWSDAALASAAWGSAAWSDAAWSDSASSDAAWSDAAWSDDSTATSVLDLPATPMTDDEIGAAESALGIVDPACDPILSVCVAPSQ